MEWISVKDKLPERGKDVLITDGKMVKIGYQGSGGVGGGYTDATCGWMAIGMNGKFSDCFPGVTYWMPLPAPPEVTP